jgi:hypothetical protein
MQARPQPILWPCEVPRCSSGNKKVSAAKFTSCEGPPFEYVRHSPHHRLVISGAGASLLIRKLETITDPSDEERQALNELPVTVRDLKTGQDIVRDQDRPSQCCLILTGFACRYKMTPAGKRQIFSFHIPGDIPDMQSIHLSVMDHSLGTLTASKVAFIPHEHVRALNRRCPRIADVFWLDTLIDAAVDGGPRPPGCIRAHGPPALRAVPALQGGGPRERARLRVAGDAS